MPHDISLTVVLWQGTSPCQEVPKLSSFRLVVLLVDDKFRIDLLVGGQLPLVISFRAVFLFVVSGAGFIPSNFNAETSEASLIEERTDDYYFRNNPLLEQPLTTFFNSMELLYQFKGVG